jgi:hypothetical protein
VFFTLVTVVFNLWVLWFPPPIKLTANIYLKILLKVPLNIITLTPITLDEKFQKRNDFREFITSTSTRKTISQMLNKYVYIRPTVKRVQIMSTNVRQLVEDHAAKLYASGCVYCIKWISILVAYTIQNDIVDIVFSSLYYGKLWAK